MGEMDLMMKKYTGVCESRGVFFDGEMECSSAILPLMFFVRNRDIEGRQIRGFSL